MSFTRCILRWGLVSGLALGGVTLLLGHDYVAASIASLRGKARTAVDQMVSDPIVLRTQLQSLAEQYPDRIAEVRGELAEVDHQLSQFSRDTEIAERVVAMTTEDLTQLKTLVARAEESSKSEARPVAIRFEGSKFDIEEAYNEARRINTVRMSYQDRLSHDQQQIKFLSEQQARLTEILNKLDSEYTTFQAQLWQLDRQIDAIERNERLIELTEQQQETLASYEKFGKVGSLKQLEGKLAELRAIQEAQLESLSKRGVHTDYENKAQLDVDSKSVLEDPFKCLEHEGVSDDSHEQAAPAGNNGKTLAFAEPIVIE